MEEDFAVNVGISCEEFLTNTLRQNLLKQLRASNEVKREYEKLSYIEYWIYDTTFAGMSGEKVYKKLIHPSKNNKQEQTLSVEAGQQALLDAGLVK